MLIRAKEDILIRDVKFDPLEYKQLRGKIKQDNSKREEVVAGITKHIEEWLRGVEFNHKTPVEEEDSSTRGGVIILNINKNLSERQFKYDLPFFYSIKNIVVLVTKSKKCCYGVISKIIIGAI